MKSQDQIKILLIEDNRLLREGILDILQHVDGFDVEAHDGARPLSEMIDEVRPDVIVSDVVYRDRDIINEIRSCDLDAAGIKVVLMDLLSIHPNIMILIEAGVSGFILNDATPADFISTIQRVHCGEKVIPQPLTDSLFRQILERSLRKSTIKFSEKIPLTAREKQVMDLIAKGLTNKEIAESLHIATFTVKTHVHNLLEKLALKTRLEIATYAFQQREIP